MNVFFFSSRRRHTRSKRDWSSDVCSSDLDSTSLPDPVDGFLSAAQTSELKGKKLGVIKQLRGQGYQDGLRDASSAALHVAAAARAETVEPDGPAIPYALDPQYLIMPAAACSNLAR